MFTLTGTRELDLALMLILGFSLGKGKAVWLVVLGGIALISNSCSNDSEIQPKSQKKQPLTKDELRERQGLRKESDAKTNFYNTLLRDQVDIVVPRVNSGIVTLNAS